MTRQNSALIKALSCMLISIYVSCTPPASKLPPATRAPSTQPSSPAQPHISDSAVTAYRPHMAPGTKRYLIVNDASITLDNDTATRSYISTRSYYTLTIGVLGNILEGTVDSFTVRRQGFIPEPSDSISQFPIHWPTSADLAPCSFTRILINRANELLPHLPAELYTAATWQDTTTTILCILDSPVPATMINDYSVIGPSTFHGDSTFLVRRRSQLQIPPYASPQRGATLAGRGILTSDFHFDRNQPGLHTRSDESSLQLEIRLPNRVTTLTQDLRSQALPSDRR